MSYTHGKTCGSIIVDNDFSMSDYGTFNNGYSSWSNMRLVKSSCETTNIVQDIMKATRIKALLQGD